MSVGPSDDPNWAWQNSFDDLSWDLSLVKCRWIMAGLCWSVSSSSGISGAGSCMPLHWWMQYKRKSETCKSSWGPVSELAHYLFCLLLLAKVKSQSWAQNQSRKALQRCMVMGIHIMGRWEPLTSSTTGPNHRDLPKTWLSSLAEKRFFGGNNHIHFHHFIFTVFCETLVGSLL